MSDHEEYVIDYFLQLAWFHFPLFHFQICYAVSPNVIEIDTKCHLLIQNMAKNVAGLFTD